MKGGKQGEKNGGNKGEKGYELEFSLLDESFPSGDEVRDATTVNLALERAIRRHPDQYLWMHKRFKTQPGGKPESPYIDIKTSLKKLRREQYEAMAGNAICLAQYGEGNRLLELENGRWLRIFPGLPGRLFKGRHPAERLDRQAKDLRLAGLDSLTADNLFRVPALSLTAAAVFPVQGPSLSSLLSSRQEGDFPLPALAAFFARLHNAGYALSRIRPGSLLLREKDFCVLNPEEARKHPTSLSGMDRRNDLDQLFYMMEAEHPGARRWRGEFCALYARAAGIEGDKHFQAAILGFTAGEHC